MQIFNLCLQFEYFKDLLRMNKWVLRVKLKQWSVLKIHYLEKWIFEIYGSANVVNAAHLTRLPGAVMFDERQ